MTFQYPVLRFEPTTSVSLNVSFTFVHCVAVLVKKVKINKV